jgi:hypothetical protein
VVIRRAWWKERSDEKALSTEKLSKMVAAMKRDFIKKLIRFTPLQPLLLLPLLFPNIPLSTFMSLFLIPHMRGNRQYLSF